MRYKWLGHYANMLQDNVNQNKTFSLGNYLLKSAA